MAIALSASPQCNTTEAYDAALKFSLKDDLTYGTNEEGSTNGWVTTKFRELQNTNSTPISLAEFMTTAAVVIEEEVVDELTDEEYNLAVYLYDNEENPIACSTLDVVSDEDEAEFYDELFGSVVNDGEEEDGGVDDGGAATTLGDNNSPSGGFMFTSAFVVVGVSFMMSAILLVTV